MEDNIKAKDYTCKCGKKAEVFWPCFERKTKPLPYCKECFDFRENWYIRKINVLGRPFKEEINEASYDYASKYCPSCGRMMPCAYHCNKNLLK
jgi:hypothetical protein